MPHPSVTALSDHVYFVESPLNGRFPFCHGFIFTGDETILVDAGLGEHLMRELDRLFHIDTLLISHSHPDHIRSWHVFRDKKILLPSETPDAVRDLDTLGTHYTGSEKVGAHWVKAIGKPLGIEPLRTPDERYGDGDVIDIGTARIEAIHAPGHYGDHYCFLDRISGTLITTDIDFSTFGPWYGNPEGNVRTFRQSVEKVMAMPYKRACSSHRPVVEGDATAQFNAFLSAFDRQKEVFFNCLGKEGATLDDIIRISPIYNNKFMDLAIQQVFEGHMGKENLDLLIEEGRVVLENGLYKPVF